MVERYAHVDDTELQRAVRITHTHADAAIKAPTKTPTGEKTAKQLRTDRIPLRARFCVD